MVMDTALLVHVTVVPEIPTSLHSSVGCSRVLAATTVSVYSSYYCSPIQKNRHTVVLAVPGIYTCRMPCRPGMRMNYR
jgi:hypothetical protein